MARRRVLPPIAGETTSTVLAIDRQGTGGRKDAPEDLLDLGRDVFDALNGDPLLALVTLALHDPSLLVPPSVCARYRPEPCRGRERETSRRRDAMRVLHVVAASQSVSLW